MPKSLTNDFSRIPRRVLLALRKRVGEALETPRPAILRVFDDDGFG